MQGSTRLALLSFLALFLTALVFTVGNGLFRLSIPLDLSARGNGPAIIGQLVACLALGGIVAPLTGHRLIYRVGHVRVYCASAALGIAMMLLLQLTTSHAFLAFGMFCAGYASSCCYLTIESWLNQQARPSLRGRVFGTYMMVFYTATATGQLALNLKDHLAANVLLVPPLLVACSIFPMAFTTSPLPETLRQARIGVRELFRRLPIGFQALFTSGLSQGPILLMGPVIATTKELGTLEASLFMASSSVGAMLFQLPIGRAADKGDRRRLLMVMLGVIAAATCLLLIAGHDVPLLCVAMFTLGGASSCIYPLAAGLFFDRLQRDEIVAASGKFLFVYGIGATIGSAACGFVMEWLGSSGFVMYLLPVIAQLAFALTVPMRRHPKLVATAGAGTDASNTIVPNADTGFEAVEVDPAAETQAQQNKQEVSREL